jgi:hypothetical protein
VPSDVTVRETEFQLRNVERDSAGIPFRRKRV